jgi:hypothetical protein
VARLPDPRCYSAKAGDNALSRLAFLVTDGDGAAGAGLRLQVRQRLEAEDDAALHEALGTAPSQIVYRTLWNSICAVADGHDSGSGDAAVVARPFAIPVIIVAGARRSLRVPGALPDITGVHALLERQGVMGTTRNFGLSAELISLETLERIRPSCVYRWNHAYAADAMDGMEGAAIEVAAGRERAHLRFLLGAGITPEHLPSFLETAADIGRWGASFTQTLARQLAQSGLELLPLARPPAALLAAAHAGRRAVVETAFQLFASHAVRTCRMTAGEPVVVVSAHRNGQAAELRVSVSSVLDDALLEGFRWPLHPLDDLGDILSSIANLLEASRVGSVSWVPQVLTERSEVPTSAFISVREFDRMADAPKSH